MQADAEKDVLLQRLDVLLQLESRNRNARGYFLTQIFEKNVQGHKFEWLQKEELEKILLEIQGVVAVINIQRREEKNEVVWFVIMLTTFPMSQEIIAPEPLVRRYQSIPLRICPFKNLLALNEPPKKPMTAVNRHFTSKADCNYVAVD